MRDELLYTKWNDKRKDMALNAVSNGLSFILQYEMTDFKKVLSEIWHLPVFLNQYIQGDYRDHIVFCCAYPRDLSL